MAPCQSIQGSTSEKRNSVESTGPRPRRGSNEKSYTLQSEQVRESLKPIGHPWSASTSMPHKYRRIAVRLSTNFGLEDIAYLLGVTPQTVAYYLKTVRL